MVTLILHSVPVNATVFQIFLAATPCTTLQTMNHELRCYLRLRFNIPNEIILLIEKHLWQRNLAPTNSAIFYFSQIFGGGTGLLYLHLNQYKGQRIHSLYRKSGKSADSKPHYYGQNCFYNLYRRTLPADTFLANEYHLLSNK